MVVTRSGTGLGVVGHVVEALGTSIVTASILGQHTAETTARDWDQRWNQKGVTHLSVQVKVLWIELNKMISLISR